MPSEAAEVRFLASHAALLAVVAVEQSEHISRRPQWEEVYDISDEELMYQRQLQTPLCSQIESSLLEAAVVEHPVGYSLCSED